ncbi:MAG TPA: hypothetical protein VHS03_13530 [Gaiellaceae bacterium]|nr:hypothetical protein [Gaiellaceae bacterium]
MRRNFRQVSLALVVALCAGAAAAGAFAAKAAPLKISAPARVLQGRTAVVSVNSKSFGCKLSVKFSNGDQQASMSPSSVVNGKVSWQWQVPQFAAAGQAKLTIACAGGGKATKPIIVVGGLIPPHVIVLKQGFSARVTGPSENVSYGLVLQNTSPNGNALSVQVLVNFVMPDNHLAGTATATIPIINAASQYDLGNEISFQGAPPIARLEIVINPGGSAKSAKNFSPAVDNVQLFPDFDPQWLGGVEGDLINVHPTLTLDNAAMSCVILDANGSVLGGSQGGAYFKLLPGTRAFFKIANGLNPIPFNNAKSALISIIPQYETTS